VPSSEFARALSRSSLNEPSRVVGDFLRADVLAQGTVNGEPTYVIGEVSYTADGVLLDERRA
jgi:hypothetical protein